MNEWEKRVADADALIDAKLTSCPGWCTFDKAKRLVRIAYTSRAIQAVELGVYGGRSLVALALGLKAAAVGARIVGVDSWAKADCLEGEQSEVDRKLWGEDTDYERLFEESAKAIERFGVGEVARLARMTTEAAAAEVPPASVDLLHLDSNHSELVSCRDVATWLPKMAPRATWICDDTNWPSMGKALAALVRGGFALVETGSEGYWQVYRRGA